MFNKQSFQELNVIKTITSETDMVLFNAYFYIVKIKKFSKNLYCSLIK